MYMNPRLAAQVQIDNDADKSTARRKAAKLWAIDQHYEREARAQRQRNGNSRLAIFRVAELMRYLRHRYGTALPNDDAGHADLLIVMNHLAHRTQPQRRMVAFCEQWSPWLHVDERSTLIERVLANPLKWKADTLGRALGLTLVERTALRIVTIAAVDVTREELHELNKRKHAAREKMRRRKAGAVVRAEYETGSAARAEPWRAMGMSRRSWYRKGKPVSERRLAQVHANYNSNDLIVGTDLCQSTGSATTKPSQRKFRAPRSSARAAEVPSPPITPAPINERVTKRYKSSERAAVTPARAQVEGLMRQALALTQSTLPVQRYNPSHMKGTTMTEPNPVETLIYNALDAASQRRRDGIMRELYIAALFRHPSWQRSHRSFACDDDTPSMSAEAMVEWLQREHPAEAQRIEREHVA